jgi:hypothetical protein
LNFLYNSLILDLVFAEISETCFLIFLVDVLGNVGGLHTCSVCLLLDEELDIDDPEDTLPTSLTSDLTLCLTSWLVLGGVVGADAGTVVGLVTRTLVEADGSADGVGDTTTVTFRVDIPVSHSFAK